MMTLWETCKPHCGKFIQMQMGTDSIYLCAVFCGLKGAYGGVDYGKIAVILVGNDGQ